MHILLRFSSSCFSFCRTHPDGTRFGVKNVRLSLLHVEPLGSREALRPYFVRHLDVWLQSRCAYSMHSLMRVLARATRKVEAENERRVPLLLSPNSRLHRWREQLFVFRGFFFSVFWPPRDYCGRFSFVWATSPFPSISFVLSSHPLRATHTHTTRDDDEPSPRGRWHTSGPPSSRRAACVYCVRVVDTHIHSPQLWLSLAFTAPGALFFFPRACVVGRVRSKA